MRDGNDDVKAPAEPARREPRPVHGEALADAIHEAGFVALGGFSAGSEDGLPPDVRYLLLIGNAGPRMFARFLRDRASERQTLDDWTRRVVDRLALRFDATVAYPFDQPYAPILRWARRAGAGQVSALGFNIHPRYGLWHAFRAALLFSRFPDPLPDPVPAPNPCDSCAGRPCLQACPVGAFTANGYDARTCAKHLAGGHGQACMEQGCLARHACPVGREFVYAAPQAAFHMRAYLENLPIVELDHQRGT